MINARDSTRSLRVRKGELVKAGRGMVVPEPGPEVWGLKSQGRCRSGVTDRAFRRREFKGIEEPVRS